MTRNIFSSPQKWRARRHRQTLLFFYPSFDWHISIFSPIQNVDGTVWLCSCCCLFVCLFTLSLLVLLIPSAFYIISKLNELSLTPKRNAHENSELSKSSPISLIRFIFDSNNSHAYLHFVRKRNENKEKREKTRRR